MDAWVDRQMISDNFEVVNTPQEADIILSNSFPPLDTPVNKLVYMTSEPPLCEPRITWYNQFHKMPLVVKYAPSNFNEIPVSIDNKHGAEFPFEICPIEPITRTDTTLTNRAVFFAGELGLEGGIDRPDCKNIRVLRRLLGVFLRDNLQGSTMIGRGWGKETSDPNGMVKILWDKSRANKQEEIAKSNCDFVLALENSMMRDYVTEKIGDGFTSDRVTLYLGCPNIEDHVPTNCFVDLRKWFNPTTKDFDFQGLLNYLKGMTQEEYDTILANARVFRRYSKEKFEANQKDLTKRIISRLKWLDSHK